MRIFNSIVAAFLVLALSLVGFAAPPTKADIDQRAVALVSRMTLLEKIDYIGGYNEFYVRPIPRLGIPELKMADGPMGVRNYGPSTAYPAGIALAASWDRNLVSRVGSAIGSDCRARGVHFILGPGMNIYRAPMNGRNFEYFGEDPFLASETAVADIKGIQGQGVSATAKHYAGNNQEWDRHHVSSDIDERTLYEIYLPAFEASVKQAHVGAIMDSYNLINGVHLTQNDYLNNKIAKQRWGFDGVIMSDWDATYDGIGAANGGLDLEMPSGKFMNRQTLLQAVKDGKVSVSTVDDKVRRILSKAIEFGWLDRPQLDRGIPLDNPASRKAALDAALGSTVLLKNENGLLPLERSKLKTLAIIGPTAAVPITGGGGSSQVQPFSAITFLQGIRDYVGSKVKVVYASGTPVPTEKFESTQFRTKPNGDKGLNAEYFNNMELNGAPALVRVDEKVNFHFGEQGYAPGAPGSNYSIRWSGYYVPTKSDEYQFYVSGDDGYRLYVNDQLLVDMWHEQADTLTIKSMHLQAGSPYKIRLEYYQKSGGANIGLGIAASSDSALQQAVSTASSADAVVLCVGFNANSEGEGSDRTYDLPAGQNELVQKILAANKNTVLVLTAGGSVNTEDWIERLPAFLHVWYPGQEGGTALAKILFGEVSPSGKLPISFERDLRDLSTFNNYYDPNKTMHVAYKEGVYLGYRHFDKASVKPLFPFGFGLSYTKFKYSNLRVSQAQSGTAVRVSFDLSNTGNREGAEIAEVYVGGGDQGIDRPVKELKGFQKVSLKPGETKRVEVQLDKRAFEYYDLRSSDWQLAGRDFQILIGASAQDIRLNGTFRPAF